MKLVAFLIDEKQPWGSNLLRGAQLSRICEYSLPGSDYHAILSSDPDQISGSTVFCTKSALVSLDLQACERLRGRDNVLIADPLDLDTTRFDFACYDILVASSITQEAYLREHYPTKPVFHVTHHVDLRMPGAQSQQKSFVPAYIGDVNNGFQLSDVRPRLSILQSKPNETQWMDEISRFSLHYGVRKRQPWDGFKPFTKGFIAAHFGAPVVVSRNDQEAVFQLGKDYPFYCDETIESVNEAIKFCQHSFLEACWFLAQDKMLEVQKRSSLPMVSKQLKDMLISI